MTTQQAGSPAAGPEGAHPGGPAVGADGMAAPQHIGPQPPPVRGSGSRPGDGGGRRAKAPRRLPRLASLQLKRIDPWTVLKISLIVTLVMFFVWMIAIGILYLLLGSMDVWSRINETFATLTATPEQAAAGQTDLVTPLRVFGIAGIVGAINIVLFTLLSTVAAFVYNAAASMSGGVELTLGERD